MSGPTSPDFLIVGAMKAGTTTLWQDLLLNDAVFFPIDKEPGSLTRDEILSEPGRQQYAALFAAARKDQVCGEASTTYTKMPDITGCAERARRVIGERLKVIYVVREPVSRVISQHHHECTDGGMTGDIDAAVREHPRLINYSRYAMQIRPWIDTFGPQAVRIVRFEDYVADRRSIVADLSRFLGVEPRVEQIDVTAAYNRSRDKPVGPQWWLRVARARWYRRMVRPMMSHDMRQAIRRKVLWRVPEVLAPPSRETVAFIISQVQDDVLELQHVAGAAQPFWDLSHVAERHATAHGHP